MAQAKRLLGIGHVLAKGHNAATCELCKARGPMRNRVMRCDDELWEAAQAVAAARGEHLSDVLRVSLARYVKRGA